ncbi:glycosyltransferase [Nakamurella sp. YIM 132087]|uniref:Glycosyltransferase n=1 Tax=Nakamurella alba TaxID=2665158 RepID=A0A7K1FL64_9ACTN|nr:glycosyltransferase [Nakamurella alba]
MPDHDAGSGPEHPAPALAVVVVTYSPGDALTSLLSCLPAAGAAAGTPVVLADNGSTDGSVQAAAAAPDVTLLAMGGNLGYGSAANAGVAVLDRRIPAVLVVNPDVVLAPGAITELCAALDRHPQAGAVGPLLTTADGVVYPSARMLPSITTGLGHALLGWCWPGNPWTRAYRRDHDTPVERTAGWLSGACLLLRRPAFEQVSGFDPGYFMYFEDVDLGERLGRAGWANVYVPTARAVHTGGHATGRDPGPMVDAHHRSAYRYLSRRYHRWYQAPLRGALRAGLAVRAALARRSPHIAGGAALPRDVPAEAPR